MNCSRLYFYWNVSSSWLLMVVRLVIKILIRKILFSSDPLHVTSWIFPLSLSLPSIFLPFLSTYTNSNLLNFTCSICNMMINVTNTLKPCHKNTKQKTELLQRFLEHIWFHHRRWICHRCNGYGTWCLIRECWFPSTVSSCKVDQATETGIHDPNLVVDICSIIQSTM